MRMGYIYIALTILFTVYGQLTLRWQMARAGELPPALTAKLFFLLQQFANPWVLSALASAFIASLCWMAAMTKFELSFAYPFMSLSFVLVMFISLLVFGELFTWHKVLGTLIIMGGLFIMTR